MRILKSETVELHKQFHIAIPQTLIAAVGAMIAGSYVASLLCMHLRWGSELTAIADTNTVDKVAKLPAGCLFSPGLHATQQREEL